jgi:hypothetical protein
LIQACIGSTAVCASSYSLSFSLSEFSVSVLESEELSLDSLFSVFWRFGSLPGFGSSSSRPPADVGAEIVALLGRCKGNR